MAGNFRSAFQMALPQTLGRSIDIAMNPSRAVSARLQAAGPLIKHSRLVAWSSWPQLALEMALFLSSVVHDQRRGPTTRQKAARYLESGARLGLWEIRA
jgi:hypothetical protein